MDQLNEIFDAVDTPKEEQSQKRAALKELISQGKTLSGKTPWTIERVDKASNKVINKLYKSVADPISSVKQKDLVSRLSGVDNVEAMMEDINSNFLIKNSASELFGKLTPSINISSHTPMEVLGSHIYEKCGIALAPLSLVCTIFNHLDWQKFAYISEERQKLAAEVIMEESADLILSEINE